MEPCGKLFYDRSRRDLGEILGSRGGHPSSMQIGYQGKAPYFAWSGAGRVSAGCGCFTGGFFPTHRLLCPVSETGWRSERLDLIEDRFYNGSPFFQNRFRFFRFHFLFKRSRSFLFRLCLVLVSLAPGPSGRGR